VTTLRAIKPAGGWANSATAHNFHPTYRPDIDGLRAVAILSVVGYHVFPEWIHGGFVGVDIFFVISGFLISTIIFRSLNSGDFSFVEFYAHRIRRIFPAMIVVISFCLLVGRQVLLPSEFEYLGKHVAASAGFVQNYVLSGESGYFNIASELKPLNHLWSLAIEEQFYAVFPLLIWIAWRLRFNLAILVAAIFFLSFAANVIDVHRDDIAAFFSLPTRAWQLMAGALIAIARQHGNDRYPLGIAGLAKWYSHLSPRVQTTVQSGGRSLLSVIGVILIGCAVFGYDSKIPYPGVAALVPVTGAVLLIVSGPTSLASRYLLSNRIAVFVGLISYPLYLWHWPLLSYLTIIDGAMPGLFARALAAVLSVLLAWLTYRYIEKPLQAAGTTWRVSIIAGLACGMIVLGTLGLKAKTLYGVYDPQTAKIIQYWNFRGYPNIDGLYVETHYGSLAFGHNENNKLLFLGDSHAEQYRNTIARSIQEHDLVDALEVLFPSYRELGIPPKIPPEFLSDPTISSITLSYFWALAYGSEKVNRAVRCCGNGLNDTIGVAGRARSPEEMDAFNQRLQALLDKLRSSGKQVYLVLDNPFGEELSPRSMLERSISHGITLLKPMELDTQAAMQRDEPARSRIIAVAHKAGAKIIDPIEYLCNQQTCPALSPDGMPIYKDYDHLSDDTVVNHVHYLDDMLGDAAARGEHATAH
jgi:peptidoglycan/LPS O-acetylase OafA/YrhL